MLRACSHLVIATANVPNMSEFFARFFEAKAHFENEMFAEFVLPSRFRVAFFKPVGASAKFFVAEGPRGHASFGVTSENVDGLYGKAISEEFKKRGVKVSGPPKTHPWGERSFLLVDPDGNRWEITESPSKDGMLVDR